MVLRLGSGYLLLVTARVVLCAAMMIASDGERSIVQESSEANPERIFPAKLNFCLSDGWALQTALAELLSSKNTADTTYPAAPDGSRHRE
jgi:hypothetical protein